MQRLWIELFHLYVFRRVGRVNRAPQGDRAPSGSRHLHLNASVAIDKAFSEIGLRHVNSYPD